MWSIFQQYLCILTVGYKLPECVHFNEAKEDNVKLYYYSKEQPDQYVQLNLSEPTQLKNQKRPIVILIHGWTETGIGLLSRKYYRDLRTLYHERNFDVIATDWSKYTITLHSIASSYTKSVGTILGKYIANVSQLNNIPLSNILPIGFSFGGQIVGFIGQTVFERTGKKLPLIIALDPAGYPFVNSTPVQDKLSQDDAEIVVAIHTSAGAYGYKESCGTIDFFPNNGVMIQDGCPDFYAIPIACSHYRAVRYYVDGLASGGFIGTKCDSYKSYLNGNCNANDRMPIAGNYSGTKSGNYYLKISKAELLQMEKTNKI